LTQKLHKYLSIQRLFPFKLLINQPRIPKYELPNANDAEPYSSEVKLPSQPTSNQSDQSKRSG